MSKRIFTFDNRKLVSLMDAGRVSRSTLQKSLGIADRTLTNWLSGKVGVHDDAVTSLASALGMSREIFVHEFSVTLRQRETADTGRRLSRNLAHPHTTNLRLTVRLSPEQVELIEGADDYSKLADAFEQVAREIRPANRLPLSTDDIVGATIRADGTIEKSKGAGGRKQTR